MRKPTSDSEARKLVSVLLEEMANDPRVIALEVPYRTIMYDLASTILAVAMAHDDQDFYRCLPEEAGRLAQRVRELGLGGTVREGRWVPK